MPTLFDRPAPGTSRYAPTAGVLTAIFAVAISLFTLAVGALASEPDGAAKALATSNAMALDDTYRVQLTIDDRGEILEFSTLTAMRHFSLSPSERHIRMRGRLWVQPDGRELLDFSIELGRKIAQKDGSSAVSSEGHWAGSAYIQSGKPLEIVENPHSTIAVTLTKQ